MEAFKQWGKMIDFSINGNIKMKKKLTTYDISI